MESYLSRYNDWALESYLRGEHGEILRREAQQVLYERGRNSTDLSNFDDDVLAEELSRRGWDCSPPRP